MGLKLKYLVFRKKDKKIAHSHPLIWFFTPLKINFILLDDFSFSLKIFSHTLKLMSFTLKFNFFIHLEITQFLLKSCIFIIFTPFKSILRPFYVISHPFFYPTVKCCHSLLIVFLLSFTFSHPLKITHSHPLSYLFPPPFHLFIISDDSSQYQVVCSSILFPSHKISPLPRLIVEAHSCTLDRSNRSQSGPSIK